MIFDTSCKSPSKVLNFEKVGKKAFEKAKKRDAIIYLLSMSNLKYGAYLIFCFLADTGLDQNADPPGGLFRSLFILLKS